VSTILSRTKTLKNGETLHLRNVKLLEAAEIIHFVKTVGVETDFLTFGAGEFNKTVAEEETIISEHLAAPNRIFIAATIQGEIVGILNVTASPKPRLQHSGEFGVSVLKKHWGKGIGRLLIETMLEWAEHSPIIRKLNLKVLANNTTALALYKSIGFEEEGYLKEDTFVNGVYQDAHVMAYFMGR